MNKYFKIIQSSFYLIVHASYSKAAFNPLIGVCKIDHIQVFYAEIYCNKTCLNVVTVFMLNYTITKH